LKLATDKLQT